MKKKSAQSMSINLLRSHNKSMFDNVFSWALSVGRLLIIITQFIALGAFLFRFVLDRQIIDLNDTIRDKQAVVKFMEQDEKKYRALMSRLTSISKYQDEALQRQVLLSQIVEMARGKMEFESFSSDGESISVEGTTVSVNLLQRLINDYKSYPGVTGVSINSIENEVLSNRIRASFTLSFTNAEQSDIQAQVQEQIQ